MAPPDAGGGASLSEVVLFTALPQGRVPGSSTDVIVAAFVTPQLGFSERIGLSQQYATSTTLSTFPDFVDWPATIAGATFLVDFDQSIVSETLSAPATPLLTDPLDSAMWQAIFPPATTRVDSHSPEDFSSVPVTSFSASGVSQLAATIHKYYFPTTGPTVDTSLSLQGGVPTSTTTPAGAAYSALVGTDADVHFKSVLDYHASVSTTAEPATTSPVIDFHAAVSSLSAYPELLPVLGLVIPLRVTLPAALQNATSFTMAIRPTWTSQHPGTISVALKTSCDLTSSGFFATPNPAYDDYAEGMLKLGNADGSSPAPQFSVLDLDVDALGEALDTLNGNVTAQVDAAASDEVVVNYALPSPRTSGVSLIWNGFGGATPPAAQTSQSFADLTTRQTAIQAAVTAALDDGTTDTIRMVTTLTLYQEDITRGHRLDVLTTNTADGSAVYVPNWQSLHWRTGNYVVGTGADQYTVSNPDVMTPNEGFVTPVAIHPPLADGTMPDSLSVHEAIARWDGWSLSAPRPGGQIQDDGTVASAQQSGPGAAANPLNPVPSTDVTDGDGNHNPQFSVAYTVPPYGYVSHNPITQQDLGVTGLPLLRFGNTYRFRARAVDLSGYSIIPTTPAKDSYTSAPFVHHRWDVVQPPVIVPTAPLQPAEGPLTVVLLDDGVNQPTSNARWLFPPKVHQLMAEHHGAFDDTTTRSVGSQSAYSIMQSHADGSPASLANIQADPRAGSLYLPLPSTSPSTDATTSWLADPAAFGLAIQSITQLTSLPTNGILPAEYEGGENLTGVFLDTWSPFKGLSWPQYAGKVLEVAPIDQGPVTDALDTYGTWSVASQGDSSPAIYTFSVTPGSVYALKVSSIIPGDAEIALAQTGFSNASINGMGAIEWAQIAWGTIYAQNGFTQLLTGNIPTVTPSTTLYTVYAVLVPTVAPSFSGQVTFARAVNDTTVAIVDDAFTIDGATTGHLTLHASWTDPVDVLDAAQGAGDQVTSTVTQTDLQLSVASPYVSTDGTQPGLVSEGTPPPGWVSIVDEQSYTLSLIHNIGDTKHHLVTYAPLAASRFSEYFTTTQTITFADTAPVLLDKRGVNANQVVVTLPSQGGLNAVTVPQSSYVVDAAKGTIAIASSDASVAIGGYPLGVQGQKAPTSTVRLIGTALEVSFVPTDTRAGTSHQVDILSSAEPPPLKIVKVAPAWSIEQSSIPGTGRHNYTRQGNYLRVYFERPFYETGLDELVGVVTGPSPQTDGTTVPADYDVDLVTILGLDPISVSGHDKSNPTNQTAIDFVTNTTMSDRPSPLGQGASANVALSPSDDPSGVPYTVWAYKPTFDAQSDLWFVDVQLDLDQAAGELPPGYFLRLSLVRVQPYSNDNVSAVSPVSLATFAQPVVNRSVSVVPSRGAYSVVVSGPGYFGFRPAHDAAMSPSAMTVKDSANPDASHPNSSKTTDVTTSTMIVEVQAYDTSSGFSGDFGWTTVPGHVYKLEPKFSSTSPIIEWTSPAVTNRTGGIRLPAAKGTYRLRISELDYYQASGNGIPATIDTSVRRSFVATINL